MSQAPGWYLDTDRPNRERYWNGSMWQNNTRPAKGGTPAFEGGELAEAKSVGDYTQELLEQMLVEQRRSANYLAILTYITVTMLVLGILAAVVGFVSASS